jgi:hypothetical protein
MEGTSFSLAYKIFDWFLHRTKTNQNCNNLQDEDILGKPVIENEKERARDK